MAKLELHYTLSGSKNPKNVLVCFHGFMGRGKDWDFLAVSEKVFDKNQQEEEGKTHPFDALLQMDLPGHGKSVNLSSLSLYQMEGAAEQVYKLFQELDIFSATLLGYSMGGRFALYFALKYPKICKKLILESASPGLRSLEERRLRVERDEKLAQRMESFSEKKFVTFLNEWYQLSLFETLYQHPRFSALLESRKENQPKELAKSLRGMGTGTQPSLWEAWQTFEKPTLLLAGEADSKFLNISNEMRQLNSNTQQVVVPNAGHNLHFEQPDHFIQTLTQHTY